MAKGFGGARSKRSLKDLPPHLQRTALWVTGGCALAACIGLVVASVWIVNVLSFLSVARSAEAGVLDVELRWTHFHDVSADVPLHRRGGRGAHRHAVELQELVELPQGPDD